MDDIIPPMHPYYFDAIKIFNDYKLLYGPIALSGVLRHHSDLVRWLKLQQHQQLQQIEDSLDILSKQE